MNVILSTFSALALLFAVITTTNGCKKHTSDSETKISASVKSAIQLDTLDPPEQESICKTHTMIVYIGNAESMGTLEFSPDIAKDKKKVTAHEASQNKKEKTYFKVIKQGGNDLADSLKENQCASYNETRISLLRIIDGPGSKDSSITLDTYGFKTVQSHMKTKDPTTVWTALDSKEYKYANKKLEALKKSESFELNMPASVEAIVRGVMEDVSKEKEVTQVIYFIKSHGGLVSTQKEDKLPGYYNYANNEVMGKIKAENLKHVLLFDSHDEDGKTVSSEVFSYLWSIKTSCELLKKDSKKYADKIREIGCDYPNYASCKEKNKDNLDYCNHLFPQVAIGQGDGNDGQGDGNDGQGDGNDGQGDGNDGQGDGNDGQGDGNDGQGDGNDGQGDGNDGQGDGNDGQGDGNDGQGDGDDGQGPGKQLMFLTGAAPKPTLAKDGKPSDSNPEWVKKIGAMASYDFEVKDGKGTDKNIYKLTLPLPAKPKAPTMIVLDSCYGADQIFNSVDSGTKDPKLMSDLISYSSKTEHAVVTLSNPKPTYYYTVNYNILDASGYLAIPSIFYWDNTGHSQGSTDQINPMAQSLREALLNPDARDKKKVIEQYNKVDIKKKEKDLDEDWLKLQPAVFILKK